MVTKLKEGTRVLTKFMFKHNAMFPYWGMNGEARRDFLLNKLKSEMEGIEFLGGEIISDLEEIEGEGDRDDIDGFLIYAITSTIWPFPLWSLREDVEIDEYRKKPMIMATDFLGGSYVMMDFNQFVRDNNLPVVLVQSSDFNDLKNALHKMKVIHSMKNSKILAVGLIEPPADSPMWVNDLIKGEPMIGWRTDPEGYKNKVKSVLGPEIVYMTADEYKEKYYDTIPMEDVKKEAELWKKDAIKIKIRDEIWLDRMCQNYLGMKKAHEQDGFDGIQMDCRTVPQQTIMEEPMKEKGIKLTRSDEFAWEFLKKIGSVPTFPCGANGRLSSEGIPAMGEGDIDTVMLNLMMQYMTNKPSFTNDPVIDVGSGQIIYAHCGPTIFNWEEIGGRIEPYELRMNCADCGVTFKGSIPLNRTVTSIGMRMKDSAMAVHTARTIGIIDKDDDHSGKMEGKCCLAEKGSVNKFVAEVSDARKIFDNYNPSIFGWHRSLILGDHRQDVIDMSKLLGLTLYEEDR